MIENDKDSINKIKYDGLISIATGSSAHAKTWKNKNIQWSDLVKKLSNTTRTPETEAEYKKLNKSEKGRIKDVGGFVGGCLKEGKRRKANVQNRSLLTLDLDYVDGDVWESINILYDFSVCMYSTHTHTPENPRYRLIIPLLRPVLPEEYQAIGRMVANDLGIDQFDDTTYDPERLMFWPSTSSDGEYVFKFQDLKWLNPEEVLDRYTFGWQDISYWPESSRTRAKMNKALKKQEDPLEKKGIIGAFCRTYTITEAIEKFLPETYIPGKDNTRYTYAEGSTTGGVVIYDDKFSYSHHGTDPASNVLCNAFDLVRIHKFGDLDSNASEDTTVSKLPSFTKMKEFASTDKEVQITLGKERMQSAKEDFEAEEDEDNEVKWLSELAYTDQGKLRSTISNFLLIIENEPLLKDKIIYNEFSNRANVTGQLPWRRKGNMQDWSDTDDSGLRDFIEKYYGISSTTKCADALVLTFEKHSFNPIKDYLEGLTWDGEKRIETLFIDYLGAEDNLYTRCVARKILVAAVARVMEPGIKFDNMPVLAGPQGIGKSTLIRKLGMDWFSDSLTTVSGKEAYEQLQGVWILEMGEMMATRKADIEATKQFLSKTEDIYRVAYGRRTSRFKRQCVFIGTTNDREFLRDKTGNRRFWPIDVGVIPIKKSVFDMTQEDIDQIWAEAVQLYKDKEPLYLNNEEEKEAIRQQENHSETNAKAGLVEEYLNKPITENWYKKSIAERKAYIQGGDFGEEPQGDIKRSKVCIMEIWVELFNGDPKQLTPMNSREINDILAGLKEWQKSKGALRFGAYGTQRAYIRKE